VDVLESAHEYLLGNVTCVIVILDVAKHERTDRLLMSSHERVERRLALAEAANLLTVPGRVCSNGKPVPVQNADWQQFVRGLRDAGMAAYKAGQSKDMDKVVEAADTVTTACMNCHDAYREKTPAQGGLAARCTK